MQEGKKTIVLGLGNLLLGDEGVGVYVVQRLSELKLPAGVEPIDGGTAGIDLLPIFREAVRVIVVDAAHGSGPPGSIYRFGPEEIGKTALEHLSLHQLSLREVLQAAELLGIKPEITIIGVEPAQVALGLELSPSVEEALPQVIEVVLKELQP